MEGPQHAERMGRCPLGRTAVLTTLALGGGIQGLSLYHLLLGATSAQLPEDTRAHVLLLGLGQTSPHQLSSLPLACGKIQNRV